MERINMGMPEIPQEYDENDAEQEMLTVIFVDEAGPEPVVLLECDARTVDEAKVQFEKKYNIENYPKLKIGTMSKIS